MNIRIMRTLLYLGVILISTAYAHEFSDFYQAARFHGTNDYNIDNWHADVAVSYRYGTARSGYNGNENKTTGLLDIYGDFNLLYMTTGVPKKAAVTDFHNSLAMHLNEQDTHNDLGKLTFDGKVTVYDAGIDLRQNIKNGVFFEGHIPIRNVKINSVSFSDKTPSSGPSGEALTDVARVKNNLNTILNAYGIHNYNDIFDRTSLGDISLMLGWQNIDRKQSFDFLEFFSLTLRGGVVFPSGIDSGTSDAFPLPTGFEGHWGIPTRINVDLGIKKWFILGGHMGALFFFDRTAHQRMKTHSKQSGWIKLASGRAEIERGTQWDAGTYMRFDRFFEGFSFVAGYSFNRKESDELTPEDTNVFSSSIVNSDEELKDWTQHTIHLLAEYDFSHHIHTKNNRWAPRAHLFYDFPVEGKRIFAIDMLGGTLGFGIQWKV